MYLEENYLDYKKMEELEKKKQDINTSLEEKLLLLEEI